jgi:hypothetical protein
MTKQHSISVKYELNSKPFTLAWNNQVWRNLGRKVLSQNNATDSANNSFSLRLYENDETFVVVSGTGIGTQGFTRQALYCLSHISSPFCPGYFGYGVLQTICPAWPQTLILPISASQVDRITGVSHRCQAKTMNLFHGTVVLAFTPLLP